MEEKVRRINRRYAEGLDCTRRAPPALGPSGLVPDADDFVVVLAQKKDATRVVDVLSKRFGEHDLTLHPDKTRLVPFIRADRDDGDDDGPGTFDLLGFTHHGGLSGIRWTRVGLMVRRLA